MELNSPSTVPERKISTRDHLSLAAFWGASNFMWGALILILVAEQVKMMVPGDKKALWTGLTIGFGSLAAIVVPLLIGPISDRCTHVLGRRRPYIFAGVVINIVGLMLMIGAYGVKSIWLFILSYFLVTLGNNVATAAYSGIIPDLVPATERGKASGYMAVLSQIGTLIGVVICGQLATRGLFVAAYLVLILALALGLYVTMKGVRETQQTEPPPPLDLKSYLASLWTPLRHEDFRWVWITRALVMLGFYMFLPLLNYYLSDAIGVKDPSAAASKIIGIVILAAAGSAYFSGTLSDQVGRKKIVFWSNVAMAVMFVVFMFCHTMEAVTLAGTFFGIAYGAYISVDWALGADVLPSEDDSAKDMAVWHVSMTLPQAIASTPAGIIVGLFGSRDVMVAGEMTKQYTPQGFQLLFAIAAVTLAFGAYFLKKVKGST